MTNAPVGLKSAEALLRLGLDRDLVAETLMRELDLSRTEADATIDAACERRRPHALD